MEGKDGDAGTNIPTRVPKHGGGLLKSGNPGNVGGTGRPSSVIRAQLRGSFEKKIETLEAFADGTVWVPIREKCPDCGRQPDSEPIDLLKLLVPFGDQLRAIDMLAKYGLGTPKELTDEVVRAKLLEQILRIRASFPEAEAEHILSVIRPVWRQ